MDQQVQGLARPDAMNGPRWSTTLAIWAALALPGLLLLGAVEPVARALDTEPGLVEYSVAAFAMVAVQSVIVMVALTRIEHASIGTLRRRWWSRQLPDPKPRHPRTITTILVICAVIGLSPLRQSLIDVGWDLLPGPSWSVNSPDANAGELPFAIGPVVMVLQLLVRIPLTVLIEETVFRGWIQDRHGVVASSLLFAAYHFAQWWTIPGLVPFGLALGLLRVLTRSLWPGASLHYLGNAGYVFVLAG